MSNIVKFVKLYKEPVLTPQPNQSINIETIAHYNIDGMYSDSKTNTTLFKIYIYFKADPSGLSYKAQGYITKEDLEEIK